MNIFHSSIRTIRFHLIMILISLEFDTNQARSYMSKMVTGTHRIDKSTLRIDTRQSLFTIAVILFRVILQ